MIRAVKIRHAVGAVCGVFCLFALTTDAAQAFGTPDCNELFASANVTKAQLFSRDGGKADFGDELHLAGAPRGKAVVCWSLDGRAAVKGKLYADKVCLPLRPCDPVTAIVEIRFRRTDGRFTRITSRSQLSQGLLASRLVQKVSPTGRFDRVRVQLFTFSDPGVGQPQKIHVATVNFAR